MLQLDIMEGIDYRMASVNGGVFWACFGVFFHDPRQKNTTLLNRFAPP